MRFLWEFMKIVALIIRQVALWLWGALRYIVPRVFRGLRAFAVWTAATRLRRRVVLGGTLILCVFVGFQVFYRLRPTLTDPRRDAWETWWAGSPEERAELITVQRTPCPGAPFILPTDGYIGLLYGDPRGPYTEFRRHQGIDIFSPGEPGITPVYAAYEGYISRNEYWTSALIQRIPDDPLHPGRQIWLYYTHMAPAHGEFDYIEDAFPPGVSEVFVEQGTLLGYTGNYSGTAVPVGVHLHFSIVLDNGFGSYANELEFDNTVDSSMYLGMSVNYACAPDAPSCTPNPVCLDAVLGAGGS